MNSIKYLLVSLTMLLMVACGGDADTSNNTSAVAPPAANSPIIPPPSDANTATPPPPTAEPPQNAVGVWHYTCPNGHEGGAGEGVPCATCGTTLVHNSVYHETGDGAVDPAAAAATPAVTDATIPPVTNAADPAATTAEPPQNAAGVWHYTCSNGCAGGAGSAVACATCGNTLAHNQAYHGGAATPATPGAPAPVATTPGGTPMTMFADPTKQPVNTTMGAAPIQPAAAPEPAQNAAGVWHYTCSNGCAGGGGGATPCTTCGTLLVHNQAYH